MVDIPEQEIRIIAKVQNNILWHAIYDNWPSLAHFCREYDTTQYSVVCGLLNLSVSPFDSRGHYRTICLRLSDILKIPVADLFPPALYKLERTEAVMEVSFLSLPEARAALQLPSPTTPEDEVADAELKSLIQESLLDLPPLERAAVHGRYIEEKTLTEIGAKIGFSRERVRQLSEQGLARIRLRFHEK